MEHLWETVPRRKIVLVKGQNTDDRYGRRAQSKMEGYLAKAPRKKKEPIETPETVATPAHSSAHLWKRAAVQALFRVSQTILGSRYDPDKIVKIAEARARERLINEQSKAQVKLIRTQADIDQRNLKSRGKIRAETEQIRQQRNIESVLSLAAEVILHQGEEFNGAPPNEDFVHRLFDDCKNIGDAELQMLWGKILGGEITRPGSFHPKTLGIVKDLTKRDADLFIKLCRFNLLIDGAFVPFVDLHQDFYNGEGLTFDDLLHLDNLGLIRFEPSNSFTFESPSSDEVVVQYWNEEEVRLKFGDRTIFQGAVVLSEAGQQLAKLADVEPIPGFFDNLVYDWTKFDLVVRKTKGALPKR